MKKILLISLLIFSSPILAAEYTVSDPAYDFDNKWFNNKQASCDDYVFWVWGTTAYCEILNDRWYAHITGNKTGYYSIDNGWALRQDSCIGGQIWDGDIQACKSPVKEEKNLGEKNCEGNPINAATGNKFQKETDFTAREGIVFTRIYNSNTAALAGSFGENWQHNYDLSLTVAFNRVMLMARRSDGQVITFLKSASTEKWIPDADIKHEITEITDVVTGITEGWQYVNEVGAIESYDALGKLLSIKSRSGDRASFQYNDVGQLARIVTSNGEAVTFTYNSANANVSSITALDGNVYQYSYNANNNLVSVSYPDGTFADSSDNPIRQYLYDDVRFPNALTGIIDENGSRYATWAYDDKGRAVSSEHAGGVERVELTYNADGTTTVRDVKGNIKTYQFEINYGVVKPKSTLMN